MRGCLNWETVLPRKSNTKQQTRTAFNDCLVATRVGNYAMKTSLTSCTCQFFFFEVLETDDCVILELREHVCCLLGNFWEAFPCWLSCGFHQTKYEGRNGFVGSFQRVLSLIRIVTPPLWFQFTLFCLKDLIIFVQRILLLFWWNIDD